MLFWPFNNFAACKIFEPDEINRWISSRDLDFLGRLRSKHSFKGLVSIMKPFLAVKINDAAKEMAARGIDVVRFSLGEPDFKSPHVVKEACIRAIRQDKTCYEHSQGLIELREAVSAHYQRKYGVSVDPGQVLVTPGTSQALFLTFSVLLKKGDGVIVPNPHYPSDTNIVEFAGGRVLSHPLRESNGFHWDLDRLKDQIRKTTRAIFVTSPANPTGALVSPREYRFMARLGLTLVSDEIYHGLSYTKREHTALEYTGNCFVVNGFSKAYAMTGYRLGYVIAPKKYVGEMQSFLQNFNISVNSFVQVAGVAALKRAQNDVKKMRVAYQKRRDLMLNGLKKLGFPIRYRPEGAFFVMANARHIDKNSYRLAWDILKNAHVAVTPGIDFGSEAEGYLRFSYAVKPALIRKGLARLKNYLKQRGETKRALSKNAPA